MVAANACAAMLNRAACCCAVQLDTFRALAALKQTSRVTRRGRGVRLTSDSRLSLEALRGNRPQHGDAQRAQVGSSDGVELRAAQLLPRVPQVVGDDGISLGDEKRGENTRARPASARAAWTGLTRLGSHGPLVGDIRAERVSIWVMVQRLMLLTVATRDAGPNTRTWFSGMRAEAP